MPGGARSPRHLWTEIGLKIAWVSDWNRWGNGKGYTVHNGNMRNHCAQIPGVEITDDPEGAKIVVDVVVPTAYYPTPGAFNVLFTMYEMGTLPPSWIKPINTADLIVVPCRHNQRLFRQYTKKPVEVCPEGVDPQLFRYHPRQFPAKDEYFNFLWVGASNPRKGFELVCAAWEGWLKSQPQMIVEHTRLILKTTKESVEERVRWMFGAIIDERRLTDAELIELYNRAHAFLLPSMGEGWGLTLNEAAATGLPCIYTPWSGPVDFMDPALSYPAKWRIYTIGAVRARDDGSTELAHSGPVALANTESLIRRMEQIYYGYSEALERGRRMAEKIHREFTWDRSARKFIEIIARHTGEKLEAAA